MLAGSENLRFPLSCSMFFAILNRLSILFSEHINSLAHKATVRCKLINKCFVSRHRPTIAKAFMVYVRPILEYCTPVWSPYLVKDIERIESVQRRFTKWLPGLHGMSYLQRLEATGLERLDVRRLRIDLILTYKILFGLTCLESADFFTLSPLQKTRGHCYKLFIPSTKSDIRKYFFSKSLESLEWLVVRHCQFL